VSEESWAFLPPANTTRATQIPAKVPLWAAVALATKNKATIVPPDWLEPSALEETLRLERESTGFQARAATSASCAPAARALCPQLGQEARDPCCLCLTLFYAPSRCPSTTLK
jgi:GINS complex protein